MNLNAHAEAKRTIENIDIVGSHITTAHSLEDIDEGHLICGIEPQQIRNILIGESAHIIPSIRIADAGDPAHALGAISRVGGDLVAQASAQLADALDGVAGVRGQGARDEFPDQRCQARALPVRRHHDLEGPVAVHAAEVEVALRRHVRDVRRDPPFFAQFPDLC